MNSTLSDIRKLGKKFFHNERGSLQYLVLPVLLTLHQYCMVIFIIILLLLGGPAGEDCEPSYKAYAFSYIRNHLKEIPLSYASEVYFSPSEQSSRYFHQVLKQPSSECILSKNPLNVILPHWFNPLQID